MTRDTQLDIYRALTMMYIICVIHVAYWMGFKPEPFASLILFEMSLIFFISGAALSLKTKDRGFWATFINRFKRVVVPFYIYAAVVVGFMALLTITWHYWGSDIDKLLGEKAATLKASTLTGYSWKDILKIVMCKNIPKAPFCWHLWFIWPYLILSCTFGIQIQLIRKVNKWLYIVLCIVIFLCVQNITHNTLLREVLFYNIFMVAGYLFYKKINIKTVLLIGMLALIFLVLFKDRFVPMQHHKFPPDYIFLLFNLVAICLFYILSQYFTLPNWKIFKIWNSRGYTIYIYQNMVFLMVYPIHMVLISKIPYMAGQFIGFSILLFIFSTLLSYLSYPLEQSIMRKLPF